MPRFVRIIHAKFCVEMQLNGREVKSHNVSTRYSKVHLQTVLCVKRRCIGHGSMVRVEHARLPVVQIRSRPPTHDAGSEGYTKEENLPYRLGVKEGAPLFALLTTANA